MKCATIRGLFLAAAVLALAAPVSAQGLIDPFGRDAVDINPADWALMRDATRKALESGKAGTAVAWKNPDNTRAGQAKLLRTFKRGTLTNCGEVEHVFTKGGGRRYVLPFCKLPDGSWKVAF
jgi:surface antigen